MVMGMKNSEIAAAIGTSVGSVKVLKNKVRNKLIKAAEAKPGELEAIKNEGFT